jgi:hypothetical protein
MPIRNGWPGAATGALAMSQVSIGNMAKGQRFCG